MSRHATFKAELVSLHPILCWVREQLGPSLFSEKELLHIDLALEEAVVNIISYAYPDDDDKGEIELSFHHEKGKYVEFVIEDRGALFNPLSHEREESSHLPIEELKEGGWGIVFIQKFMDEVAYIRRNKKNVLTLRKDLA